MEKWVVTAKRADFQKIAEEFRIDPVIARLIRNRDVQSMEEIRQYLYGGLSDIPSPWLLKDMETAVEILRQKIKDKKPVRVIGDYDIDGVMASYILLKGLRNLGAVVDTYIPDRVKDGYGLQEELICRAAEDNIDTIVTCDNGIAASAEIALAKKMGLTVIVTDHHEVPFEEIDGEKKEILPPADAIVNPKQKKCAYPNKNICGAVTAWKLIWALYEREDFSKKEILSFLEFAAIATVGDVMELQGENRILVKEGLKALATTKNLGLLALMEKNALEPEQVTAYHIGFVLGPCINAGGRLDTALRSLSLLLSEDWETAAKLAGDLTALNQSRKALTEKGKEDAMVQAETTEIKNDRVLVIYLPDCHESLAGIIAGKIRELYYKPVFVLTKTETGVKGSGRSIEAYSMYEELTKCSDLMDRFGGHPMAAGLSMKEEYVEIFRRRLNEACTLTEEDLQPKVVIDVPMPISYISKKLIGQLSLLEPYGKGNEKPLFAQKEIFVSGIRIFGKSRNVAKMQVKDTTGTTMDAVYFGEADAFVSYVRGKEKIMITYYPEINVYQGRESIQIVIRNYC